MDPSALDGLKQAVTDLANTVADYRANAVTRDDVAAVVRDVLIAEAALDSTTPRREVSPRDTGPRRRRGSVTMLAKDDSFADWYRATGGDPMGRTASEGEYSLGRVLGALVGKVDRSSLTALEASSLNEGTDSAGGYLVPEPLAPFVVDRIRNRARVIEAGAQVVPMDVDSLAIARITGPSTPSWRNELDAVTQSSQTFDRIQFKAKTAATLVRLSDELWEDLSPAGLQAIESEIFAELALALDLGVLRGTGVAPEPKGIRNQTGVNIVPLGANGATPADFDHLLDAIGAVWQNNGEPNAAIYSARTATTYAKLKTGLASDKTQLQVPREVQALDRLVSNQVPNNLTVGTSNNCSEAYVGDWSSVLIGMRPQVRLRVLTERFQDTMEMAVLAYLRADVQMSHPEHMTVVTGIRP